MTEHPNESHAGVEFAPVCTAVGSWRRRRLKERVRVSVSDWQGSREALRLALERLVLPPD
jgi:hypothetical protein